MSQEPGEIPNDPGAEEKPRHLRLVPPIKSEHVDGETPKSLHAHSQEKRHLTLVPPIEPDRTDGQLAEVRDKLQETSDQSQEPQDDPIASTEATVKSHKKTMTAKMSDAFAKIIPGMETWDEQNARLNREAEIREHGSPEQQLQLEAQKQRQRAKQKWLDHWFPRQMQGCFGPMDGGEDKQIQQLKEQVRIFVAAFKDIANAARGKPAHHWYEATQQTRDDRDDYKNAKEIERAAKQGNYGPLIVRLTKEQKKIDQQLEDRETERAKLEIKLAGKTEEEMDYVKLEELEQAGKKEEADELRSEYNLRHDLLDNRAQERHLTRRKQDIAGMLKQEKTIEAKISESPDQQLPQAA